MSTAENWTMSDELDGIPLGTAKEERGRAKLWMDDAARHARNSDYWRERAGKAEGEAEDHILVPNGDGGWARAKRPEGSAIVPPYKGPTCKYCGGPVDKEGQVHAGGCGNIG